MVFTVALLGFIATRASRSVHRWPRVKHGTLKTYPGFPHGMPTTHAEQINADLLEFIKRDTGAAVGAAV